MPKHFTTNGYWKETGPNKDIKDGNGKNIGVKKSLVFYGGTKTNWIMHEYIIREHQRAANDEPDHMKLDDYVLCRIYEKKRGNSNRNTVPIVDVDDSDEVEVEVEDGFEVEEEEEDQGQGAAANREEECINKAGEGVDREEMAYLKLMWV
ncbi:PREDICTED: NAC domain-containing protein 72-like [Nelumbo nucifera]|uniref:NAC domain-containing protein 72-like n=1 Tax=Nelumbo nucifera TaxID=4432 RepID=A0A1U8ASP5_NELNU|nr:PREDICTED: NAC domain-containing protein 72-like [Nelumbo nucifera]